MGCLFLIQKNMAFKNSPSRSSNDWWTLKYANATSLQPPPGHSRRDKAGGTQRGFKFKSKNLREEKRAKEWCRTYDNPALSCLTPPSHAPSQPALPRLAPSLPAPLPHTGVKQLKLVVWRSRTRFATQRNGSSRDVQTKAPSVTCIRIRIGAASFPPNPEGKTKGRNLFFCPFPAHCFFFYQLVQIKSFIQKRQQLICTK